MGSIMLGYMLGLYRDVRALGLVEIQGSLEGIRMMELYLLSLLSRFTV